MMPTFDYASIRGKADALIAKFGQSVTFTRKVESGEYDVGDGLSVVTETTFTATVVVLPTGEAKISAFDQARRPELVDSARRFLIVSAEDIDHVPQATDTVEFESETWNVTGVTPLAPGGTDLIYNMGVKRV